jgi:SAM-dependent methyltransferase
VGRGFEPYWDALYRSDPECFGTEASPLARTSVSTLAREHPGGLVLELGCGTGRDLLYFAHHGFEVRGCDVSTVAARATNARLSALRHEVPPVQRVRAEDALEFLRRQPSAGAAAVFTNRYIDLEVTRERVDAVLREVARVLDPDGWFFLSARSVSDAGARRGPPIAENAVDPGEGRPPLRFYTEAEIRRWAEPSFELATLREHPDGTPDLPIILWWASLRRRAARV